MADQIFPKSQLPIRRTVELLPSIFRTETNSKFFGAVVDPLIQPGVLEKTTGYIGRRYGKTFRSADVYLDDDGTLRSRYQLEPGVVTKNLDKIESFVDYIDLKNQIKFFGNNEEIDTKTTGQPHYTWNPPIDWDKFVNYREYFWEPLGPPSVDVFGNFAGVTSTYKVSLGFGSTYIFSPDGFTNNPTLTLYRGQRYVFKVNVPREGFTIKTNYDTGSLLFNPNVFYAQGQLVTFGDKLWRSKVDINPNDGSTIDENSEDWEFVEDVGAGTALDYNVGVTNNGAELGDVIFEVPYDAPDVLFYQSSVTADRFGRFIISGIEDNTKIDIEKEIIGKVTYTSSNGVEFTNGLVVSFRGKVTPSKYATDTWLIEGVGESISLKRFNDLVAPAINENDPEVLFDNAGFDSEPFDDATAFPQAKDYIVINRSSKDDNPWSRYNRWFHRSVLEYAYKARGQDFPSSELQRAKRPIIEFQPDLQLFNHGSLAKVSVDYVDTFTDDVFSKIEGSAGYNIDGEFLFDGARILVIADNDVLTNNKIYKVQFITHNGRKQIHLKLENDATSNLGDCVLVKRGTINLGKMFHFNGTNWVRSQEKTKVNQAPMFDAYDETGVSFSNLEKYPVSSFVGTKILSYKIGNSVPDIELGFSLSYLNIDNVGDIQFDWVWDTDSVTYLENKRPQTVNVSAGYYLFNNQKQYQNGWDLLESRYLQPIIDSVTLNETTDTVTLQAVNWDEFDADQDSEINFYINGFKVDVEYTRFNDDFTFNRTFSQGDVLSLKIVSNIEPRLGYYEIPVGLEKNPLNQNLRYFTFGEASDHLLTSIEWDKEFQGSIPGNSNLRNLFDYRKYGKRFLKHSGIAPLSMLLLCDKKFNAIKAVQFAKKSYSEFKNSFLIKSTELETNDNIPEFVDEIINVLGKTKTSKSAFADSDMLGSGAFSTIIYEVEDTGIKTFSLSQKFNLEELSSKAVYVYINQQQLLVGKDYAFNSDFGFVVLNVELSEGDIVEIREYVSTSFNYIPPTPTKLGLYKKYTPRKFVDDTYTEPREVIQGHDGSITACYGDFRDDLLMELELRIYNNLKQSYDEDLFDIDAILGGYYGNSEFTKSQLDNIVNQEFLKWISNTNIGYTLNDYFDSENSFTYTYSSMTDQTGSINLPGYWRGIYKWFYDTDRPHTNPWEMLGFTEKPDWWDLEYGPYPYTPNNLILWEDIRDGIIRQGPRAGQHDRYARPTILLHPPVDNDGQLLSPLDSGLALNFTLVNNKGSFVFGDQGPVEYAWRSSSEWPFAVTIALMLLKPFDFINKNFDLSRNTVNKLNQLVDKSSNKFKTINDIVIPDTGEGLASGLVNYLISYVKHLGLEVSDLRNKIYSIDVALASRISGFVDKTQQKYLLDSKSPRSTSSSIFIPPENYDIIFNVSVPVAAIGYSGVLIEKTPRGWQVSGYDLINPYFYYYEAISTQSDPLISVGGISAPYTEWTADRVFNNGEIVLYRGDYYRALKTNQTSEFEKTNWTRIPKLPLRGAVEAFQRKNFNFFALKKLSYGDELTSIQQVVDFLLGYEEYLKSIGFVFDQYDRNLKVTKNWLTSAKEFMFWTRHNWDIGSLITLSPLAEKVTITIPVGVAESFLDSFYDYQIFKSNGTPLRPEFIDVKRDFQKVEISITNTTEGIYFLKAFYVLKENVVVFSDRTVFNDVIYDKTTGYRQDRIKVQGFRTVDWDGDYTSPGFLFDNVNIDAWVPFVDYKLGDIVEYKSYFWVSQFNQQGSEEFDEAAWSRLDSTPTKSLVPNFDYRINLFEDYFEVDTDGVGIVQRELARHTIGYQTRTYLQNLSEDSVTQLRLYRGFIREKGTNNAIVKVFDKLSDTAESSIDLKEEWAFRVGRLGGYDQLREQEVQLNKDQFLINPQPIEYVDTLPAFQTDRFYRIINPDFTILPDDISNGFIPTSYDSLPFLTAGYVKADQVDLIVGSRDALLGLDIESLTINQNIWITFEGLSWNVYRFVQSPILFVVGIERNDTELVVTFNRTHTFKVGDVIGFKISKLTGLYEVVSIPEDSTSTITIEIPSDAEDPEFEASSFANVWILVSARFTNYDSVERPDAALLPNDAKLWIDKDQDNLWEVIQKKKQYSFKSVLDYGVSDPSRTGAKVLYDDKNKRVIASIPGSGYVMVYIETPTGLSLRQIIEPPQGFFDNALGSWGEEMAISYDSKWLVIGSPMASAMTSYYQGEYNPALNYAEGDIVLYEGKLWKAKTNTLSVDGSTINIYSGDWELATSIPVSSTGTAVGDREQGFISIYEYAQDQWNLRTSLLSPRPSANEHFGSSIAIGGTNGTYYLAVSAPGSLGNKGRVYLFSYTTGSTWSILENANYRGAYSDISGEFYPKDTVVWFRGDLYKALNDTNGDGSSQAIVESHDWIKIDPVTTNCSLPQSIAVEDDGSTLAAGLINPTQIAELVKEEDRFGTTLTMSSDGKTLIVGAPDSDGQFISNYRGYWRSDYEYVQGDAVRYNDFYYRLVNDNVTDSALRSYNQQPDLGDPWEIVTSVSPENSGKIFVYQRNDSEIFELVQTLTATSLDDFSDLESGTTFGAGDRFGYAMKLNPSGNVLVVSAPETDITFENPGVVYVMEKETDTNFFRIKQKLETYEENPNEWFGESVCLSPDGQKIVVGAKNFPFQTPVSFDLPVTTFDGGTTTFFDRKGYAGGVYVFEKKDGIYFLTEKLEADLSPFESFGSSVDCVGSVIVVGSPDYIKPSEINTTQFEVYEGPKIGNVRIFKKDPSVNSWETIAIQQPTADIGKVRGMALYNNVANFKITDLDVVDPAKYKILGIADQELKFKTEYDPAVYSVGTEEVIADTDIAWAEKHVGELWWDISKSKWLYYEQGDTFYKSSNWSKLAEGAEVQVCEWVETPLLPSEWAAIADTTEGLSLNVSGQPLYPNDDIYSFKTLFNTSTGEPSGLLYYYWVRTKTTLPNGVRNRRLSAAEVEILIRDPAATGVPFIGLANNNTVLAFNFESLLSDNTALLNMLFSKGDRTLNEIHNEYQIISEDSPGDVPSQSLETKWLDSLIGFDQAGNRVPDTNLPAKQKYGISFRPRQSMFVDRLTALKNSIVYVNNILLKEPFSDIIDFSLLTSKEDPPVSELNQYDQTIDTFLDIGTVGTVRVKQAEIRAIIVDGRIDSIEVIDPGFGYKNKSPCPILIEGDGIGAEAFGNFDQQGRLASVGVITGGRKYTTATATIRRFSVLVNSDEEQNGRWSIYSWDDIRKLFFRTRSQAFDVTRFWNYADWWKEGYSITSRIVAEIVAVYEEPELSTNIGDLIRIKEYGNGGWAVLEKIANDGDQLLDRYRLVGRENGTIQFADTLYDTSVSGVGFDNVKSFDTDLYDVENTKELRIILQAVKENIFLGNYAVEWNRLFFNSIRFVFAEQRYVDWAFKTSLLRATHNVGELKQKLNYKNDNLESYVDYINEVKPYRTTIRNYTSAYDSIDRYGAAVTDFDLPPVYSTVSDQILPVDTNAGSELESYPWKWWTDNNSFSVVSIVVTDGGNGYNSVPSVFIEGDGTGAKATAFISNGRVVSIQVNDPGVGYTRAPLISIVGGNGTSQNIAKASAILGDSKIRSFRLGLKFDRITKNGVYSEFVRAEEFTASGSSSVFELKYPPTRDKSKITVVLNDEIVLKSEYSISLYKTSIDGFESLRGRLVFNQAPVIGSIIGIEYEINDDILDSVNRINRYYEPNTGMKSKDLDQLMTGIDFGGVKIQGTTFDVTGGWDALPWFTDTWDSVQANSDYYVVVDGSTTDVVLPFVPAQGQRINIYLKRAGTARNRDILNLQYDPEVPEQPTIRIDDSNFDENWDSTSSINPNAQMPTFVGDGSTRIIPIGIYIQTNAGDTLIFRPEESDGSVIITDPTVLDTVVTGGSLVNVGGAYSTANGRLAEEIVVDGGEFISPDQIQSPEEVVPGQVLDSVSIKVFDAPNTGTAPIQNKILIADGSTRSYDIGLKIFENSSVVVYVDKIKKLVNEDYEIDYSNNQIQFLVAPAENSYIEIVAIGIGGIAILDYQEFTADGDTNLFLTDANFETTARIVVTVNGVLTDAEFVSSEQFVDPIGRTLVRFGRNPEQASVIKIICLGGGADTDSTGYSIVRINQQTVTFEGSTRRFSLDNFVKLSRGSAESSAIVELNGVALIGPDTDVIVYDGTNGTIVLGRDPFKPAGAILPSNIRVFINEELQIFIQDYDYDGVSKELIITNDALALGDRIKVEVDIDSEYRFEDNDLVINPGVTLVDEDQITVTWFSEYPTMDIIQDEFVGGQAVYKLRAIPLDGSYVWVYKNGVRLTRGLDYRVSIPRGVVYLTTQVDVDPYDYDNDHTNDTIKIVQFGSSVFKESAAYQIHKDMLNVYQYSRHSETDDLVLTQDLRYYDTVIHLTDTADLFVPDASRNIEGVVLINGERISYLEKTSTTLTKLRRGVFGTSIPENHPTGSRIIDCSSKETIPYTESQERTDFVGDGSTTLIGPLPFTPNKFSKNNWFRGNDTETAIPEEFGPCYEIEVFVGGRRLRKDPTHIYNELLGTTSPAADEQVSAEFSVDGTSAYVRLTEPAAAGSRITIIRRLGKTWYDKGGNTASAGVTLLENTGSIPKFIAGKSTRLPE